MIYKFDAFELDGAQYLSRGEETIHVEPGVVKLLVLLIEHRFSVPLSSGGIR